MTFDEEECELRQKLLKEKTSFGFFGVQKRGNMWGAQREGADGRIICGESFESMEDAAKQSE